MAKSFFEKLARELGKATGKVVEKARDAGLDKKAKDVAESAEEKISNLVSEYKEGVEEASSDDESAEKSNVDKEGVDADRADDGDSAVAETPDDELSPKNEPGDDGKVAKDASESTG